MMREESKMRTEDDDNLTLEIDESVETDSEPSSAQSASDSAGADDSDEVLVTIGDEEIAPDETTAAPEWVRDLRKKNREDQRRIRDLEEQLRRRDAPTQAQPLGKKPSLDDFDYDVEKYEDAIAVWHERKRTSDLEQERTRQAEQEADAAWSKRMEGYTKARDTLKVRDFEDAEAVTGDALSNVQQGIIISGADNPALVVYALGKNPKRAKELAGITDPVQFAFAIAKLETQLKIQSKKTPPPPEKSVRGGSAPVSGAVDSTLERLRDEAARTGDMSKVIAYKRSKRS
jgi:hypothetical protein